MLERRCRRRRSLRSVLLFAVGFCSLFACFSWYTLLCCRPNIYGEYVINNYPTYHMANAEASRATFSSGDSKELPQVKETSKTISLQSKLSYSSETEIQGSSLVSNSIPYVQHSSFKNSSGQLVVDNQIIKSRHKSRKEDPVTDSSLLRVSGNLENYQVNTVASYQSQMTTPELASSTSSPQSLPPTIELDQYAVKAWLPRGIKERIESSSYESPQVGTDINSSSLDVFSVLTTTTPGYTYAGQQRKRSVISPPIKRLPQALIIGVKKCGTRALLEFLRVHPDIRASGPETHFFDRHYQKGLEWYRQQMPTSLEGQITMEKTPSYFITKEVPPRIHSMSPSVRLLVVVRDPVTRAISDYTQSTSKRKDTPSFEEMAFLNVSTGLVDTSWSAIRIGVYARFLEWWTRYFSLDRILFISGENLIRDPAGEMGRVQDFLDLKQVISDKHFYFNETKGFPCLKKSEGSGNPHCLGKTKGRTHPDISLSTIQRLRDFYRPFNVKFYQMVGRNFGWP